MHTASGEGINWIHLLSSTGIITGRLYIYNYQSFCSTTIDLCNLYLAKVFFMATHMKHYRKMGEIIRKIGHLERKLSKVLGNKRKRIIG